MKSLLGKAIDGPLKFVYETQLWNRLFKNRCELGYWRKNLAAMEAWYSGEQEFRGFPFPEGTEKETRFDPTTNAAMTYIDAENRLASYLTDLRLGADAFAGKKVADIGSGPMPTLLVFEDCERWCVDHLIDDYEELGYPLEQYREEVTFLGASSESMPVEDDFFDAVISRNALDHVDDFDATAAEICRATKPGGWIHLLLNYHPPTRTETQILSDERVRRVFAGRDLRIVEEEEDAWGFEGGKTVLWSNVPEKLIQPKGAVRLDSVATGV